MTYDCLLDVFDDAERARYGALRAAMKAGTTGTHALPDGYAVRLKPDATLFQQAAEWITLERRCCPFLDLGLEWSAADAVSVRLTGGPDVKAYLAGTFDR
jgi:hypothetical protein